MANNNYYKPLALTIHIQSNGIFRIRITDPSHQRYVVDSLVLNENEMIGMDSKNIVYYDNEEKKLRELFMLNDNHKNNKKYRGFEVNVNGETYKLILQLSPFEIYYFQENDLFMSMNSDQLMYFENLRDKEGQTEQQKNL